MKQNNRGDTLVEVLLATVVLSIVIAGAYNLSNRATRLNQQAYERTQVSNFLQEQAEYLRASRDTNTSTSGEVWDDVLSIGDTASTFNCSTDNLANIASLPADVFHMSTNGVGDIVLTPGETVINTYFNIWIEKTTDATSVDFEINACWEGIGDSVNQKSGIVLRLEKT